MKILREQWFITFLLLPFLLPYTIFNFFPSLNLVYDASRVFWCALIMLIYIYRGKLTPFIIFVFFYGLAMFVSIAISQTGIYNSLSAIYRYIISGITISMLFDMCLQESIEVTLRSYIHLYTVFVIINFVFILIYPEGVVLALIEGGRELYYEGCHFLGLRNQMIYFLLPYISSLILYSYYERNKLSAFSIIMLFITSTTMFLTWSAAGVTAWLIILIYLFIIAMTRLRQFVNFRNIFISSVILYIAIVVVRIQNAIRFFIEGFLGRNMTFTGRTILWDFLIPYIGQKPFFGYGEDVNEILGIYNLEFIGSQAHNQVIDILLRGGVVALILWLAMLMVCGRKLQSVKIHPFSSMMSAALFALFTALLVEAKLGLITLYILYAIAYYTPEIILQYEKKWNNAEY